MTQLEKLKASKTLTDLAKLLGFTPAGLSYILYKMKDDQKYRTFNIPKKSGGVREINAPTGQLSLLQKRLAGILADSVKELSRENPRYWQASHGFRTDRTIVSNANIHRRRRYVFNLDIENFFEALNFGRVRGFFLKDRHFSLAEPVATIVAQIACYENKLPQGSPCSPVISNLLGNILDSRMLALAKKTRCTYTRYADDLTFSTNLKEFPSDIGEITQSGDWEAGEKLDKEIMKCGLALNAAKTRMALRQSRQSVTGLVVNTKPNINQQYYRYVRSMCNSLFQNGYYYRPDFNSDEPEFLDNINPLEGMLSHVHFVKSRRDRPPKINKEAVKSGEFVEPRAPIDLYRKFLFFKHFVTPSSPLIVTEGVSDITYLKCAIKALHAECPSLCDEADGKIVPSVRFLTPSGTARTILNLGSGTDGQSKLIAEYQNRFRKFKHRPIDHPVIILCDNDDGCKKVFSEARKKSENEVSVTTTSTFYYLGLNLYLIKVPEGDSPASRDIEDLFPSEVLAMHLEGKPFNKKKEHGDASAYGKVAFAESVVRPNLNEIDFSNFIPFLQRIEACLVHYTALGLAGGSQSPPIKQSNES